MRIFYFFLIVFLSSCLDPRRFSPEEGGSAPANNQGGFTPPAANSDQSSAPSAPAGSKSCTTSRVDAWGGVTCSSGSNTDQNFRNFLSVGERTEGGAAGKGEIGNIDCQPSSRGGILFKISAVVSGTFDPGGNNANLNIQNAGSSLRLITFHTPVSEAQRQRACQSSLSGGVCQSEPSDLPAVRGNINGNRANLVFEDNSGRIIFDGRFDAQSFTGTVQFSNTKNANANSSPHSGTLGSFSVPTCSVFFAVP